LRLGHHIGRLESKRAQASSVSPPLPPLVLISSVLPAALSRINSLQRPGFRPGASQAQQSSTLFTNMPSSLLACTSATTSLTACIFWRQKRHKTLGIQNLQKRLKDEKSSQNSRALISPGPTCFAGTLRVRLRQLPSPSTGRDEVQPPSHTPAAVPPPRP